MGSAAGWLTHILVWLVILAVTATLMVSVLIPRITGATPYTILTGSMKPSMPPGTMVVVRPRPFEAIGVGEVITYQLESGNSTVVTHRVTSVGINGARKRTLQTQGDANQVPDTQPVQPVQVKGVVWYSVPHLGRVTNLISGAQRQIVIYGVVALLLLYSAGMFAIELRGRRRKRVVRDG